MPLTAIVEKDVSAMMPKHHRVGNEASGTEELGAKGERPPSYEEFTHQPTLTYGSIIRDQAETNSSSGPTWNRVIGKYIENDIETRIWIEWKSYRAELCRDDHNREPKWMPAPSNVARVKELITLLKNSQIASFRIPRCLGYFDDGSDNTESEHPDRFGIVFAYPSTNLLAPISLLEAIKTRPCPSLSVRVDLSHKIATSLLHLHAVKWLHKSLRSDSILFFITNSGRIDYTSPYLTNFEYARPDRDGIHSTAHGALNDPLTELYVHPDYQGDNAVGTYRKTFDIYSLGIILLEIACWEPLSKILKFNDPQHPTLGEAAAVRDLTLKQETLTRVMAMGGDKFHTAVESCVKGLQGFGLKDGVDEMDPIIGTGLMRAFNTKVVQGLGDIVL